jgi:hypothetical protein
VLKSRLFLSFAAVGTVSAALTLYADAPAKDESTSAAKEPSPQRPLTVDEARNQARLLQTTYEATLHVMHKHYFDAEEKVTIPAKALEDVFKLTDEGTGRSTRWIAVSTPAMNVDHKPQAGFEETAAEALRSGEKEYESIEGNVYRRAGSIKLFASCLRCHESGLTKQITKDRVAGFVMSIPIEDEQVSK